MYADGNATPFASVTGSRSENRCVISESTLWIGATGHGYNGGECFVGSIDHVIVAVHEPAPPKFLPPVLVGDQLTLTWTGTGVLQSAPTVPGSWTDVTPAPTGQTYTTKIVPGESRFYLLRP